MSYVEYIIKGDTKKFNDCLICCCGEDKSRAEETLNRMISNPTDNDKRLIAGHTNLRIKEVPKEKCWWNGYLD